MLKTSRMNNSVAAFSFRKPRASERCCGVLSGVMNGLGSLCGQSLFGSEVEKEEGSIVFISEEREKSKEEGAEARNGRYVDRREGQTHTLRSGRRRALR